MVAPIEPASTRWLRHSSRTHATLLGIVLTLLGCLSAFPLVIALVEHDGRWPWIALFAALELVAICLFSAWARGHADRFAVPAQTLRRDHLAWLVAFALPIAGLIAVSAEAAYAALPLYFIVLWLLPARIGAATTMTLAAFVIAGQSVHHGFNFGAVAGPLVSAVAAIGIMLSTRAMMLANLENERLVRDLTAAQSRLSASERDAGRLAERARLGQELHDTVAQHLSSIQLLLGAAERADAETAGAHIERAKQAARDALTQTRAFIKDLAPPQLDGATLAAALERLAGEVATSPGETPAPACEFVLEGVRRTAPMPVETALLRVAQEACTNARRHGAATCIAIRLQYTADEVVLDVDDDGIGFDADAWFAASPRDDGTGYGLAGMRSRLERVGGRLVVISEPGEGALVRASFPLAPAAEGADS